MRFERRFTLFEKNIAIGTPVSSPHWAKTKCGLIHPVGYCYNPIFIEDEISNTILKNKAFFETIKGIKVP